MDYTEDAPEEYLPETQTQEYHSQQTLINDEVIRGPMPWGRLFSLIPGVETVDLTGPLISWGRSVYCTITVLKSNFPENQCNNISKEHFVLRKEPGKPVFLTDKSKNGTFVNGKLVGRENCNVLQNDDIISVGHKRFKVYVLKLLDLDDYSYLPPELREKYVAAQFLGRGACGEVRLAYEKSTCRQFAIKKILLGNYSSGNINHMDHPLKVQNEAKILRALSHTFIIQMFDIVETTESVFIVLEYMAGGELTNRILSTERPLTEQETKFIFYQILLGVQYLHHQGITHRDLKPQNVLLSSTNVEPLVKITDFGLSKMLEDGDLMRTTCGTPYYVAPEVIDVSKDRYNHKVDVWSLGVILFYMLSKQLPFFAQNHRDLQTQIIAGNLQFDNKNWEKISKSAKELVKRMLVVNPVNRININFTISHPWLAHDPKVRYKIGRLINQLVNDEEDDHSAKKRAKLNNGDNRKQFTI